MPRADRFDALDASIGDPRQGLPEDIFLFVSRIAPLITVDLLIQDEGGRTLLTWRDDEHYGCGWHVPGGVIRYKETAAERIRACARHELGVEVVHDAVPIAVNESIIQPRERGHAVSLLFRCRLLGAPDPARAAGAGPPARGDWRWHATPPPDLLAVQMAYTRFF